MLTFQLLRYTPMWIRAGSSQSIGGFTPVAEKSIEEKPWT